ncbi:Homeodomain protein 2 [Sarcoptes scabiei]|uniref:Homeodomain protein 2 n=1 Tax=Sarcoptes scabiei TaxID=52283 RepID=A0A132A6E0_SARSC|nr:Homeodomain protein 2 [Sarcoptes scabiei]
MRFLILFILIFSIWESLGSQVQTNTTTDLITSSNTLISNHGVNNHVTTAVGHIGRLPNALANHHDHHRPSAHSHHSGTNPNHHHHQLHPNSLRPLAASLSFATGFPWATRGKPRRGMMRRAVFSDAQRQGLEKRFQMQKYISKPDRKKLAEKLGLKDSQIEINSHKNLKKRLELKLTKFLLTVREK